MKINRHNYEEYFILYSDNELSSDDHRMVEEFVLLNPDLKDELDAYLNTILLPDALAGLDNKEELYHYDESLISYLDNELPAGERSDLEKLISASPKLQQEFDLYRKTKLQPETAIVFENKSVLYRNTERRRVVPMTIIRWSVAAAILLAISVTAIKVFNKKPNEPVTAGINNPTKVSDDHTAGNNPTIEKIPVSPQIEKPEQKSLAQAKEKPATDLKKKRANDLIKNQEKQNDIIATTNNQPPSNNLPTRQDNPYLTSGNQKKDALVVKTNQKPTDAVTISDNDPYNNQKTGSNQTNDAGPTFAKNILPPEDGGVEEGGQNKKSRGLFRKLTRVFEKNTGIKATDDDEKLHIAAFTVKLK